MFLLVAVLNSDAHVRKVLEGFTAIDVGGATVIDSRGMGQMLAADIPIVAGIARLLGGSPVQESSRTIFVVPVAEAYGLIEPEPLPLDIP